MTLKYLVIASLLGPMALASKAEAQSTAYSYDARGRLIAVDVQGGTYPWAATYSYDKSGNRTIVSSTNKAGNIAPTYRFAYARHFYTNSYAEGVSYGLTPEGVAFRSYGSGGTGYSAIYRCYNAAGDDHFISLASTCEGSTQEGIHGYVANAGGGSLIALYRFYKSSTGDHLITTNYNEGASNGYALEATLGYVPS